MSDTLSASFDVQMKNNGAVAPLFQNNGKPIDKPPNRRWLMSTNRATICTIKIERHGGVPLRAFALLRGTPPRKSP